MCDTVFLLSHEIKDEWGKVRRMIKLFFLAAILFLITACGDRSTIAPPVDISPTPEVNIQLPVLDIAYIPEEDMENMPFEIYAIKGTAPAISGARLERMSAWREEAAVLAEKYREIVYINKNPAYNTVYLTFDDGPDPVNTVSVINTLIEYGVSGTFFFTGENIRRHPNVVKKAYEAGFPIGLHGYAHASFLTLTEDEIIAELNESNDLLEQITGARSTIMRPPFGAIGDREIEIIHSLGLTIYLWSLDTLDWAQTEAAEILRNVEEYLRPGEIILMHAFSGQARSAAILPRIIEFILEQGYEIKALQPSPSP